MPGYFEDQDMPQAKEKKKTFYHSKRQRNNDHIISRISWSNIRKVNKTLQQEITDKISKITTCKTEQLWLHSSVQIINFIRDRNMSKKLIQTIAKIPVHFKHL